jgi:hypothetical protein
MSWWMLRQVDRWNEKDRPMYDGASDDYWLLLLHIREDVRLIATILFVSLRVGLFIAAGVIADQFFPDAKPWWFA